MKKIMRIGTIVTNNRYRNIHTSIYVKAEIDNGNLSIVGVVGPLKNGDALGSCGQIDMDFAHRNKKDNDKRYTNLIKPEEIKFAKGWDKEKWFDLLTIWKRWHLNNMNAECEHQKELGWTYKEHHNPKTFKGDKCPVCGYSIGSKWLKEELPKYVTTMLENFPNTDQEPAWI